MSDGSGDVVTGSVRISADNAIGGVLKFGLPRFGVAGVTHSELTPRGFAAPVKRDESQGLDTGIAIRNAGDSTVTLKLTLTTQEGAVVESGRATIEDLTPKGHIAKFLSELFPEADTESFEGMLTVEVSTPGGKIAGTALELGTEPGQFTTLPVIILE